MVLDGVRVVPDSIEGEVADLCRRLSERIHTDVGPREVTRVTLPAGPAVRLQLLAHDGDPGHSAAEGDTVLDVIQFWVPAPAHPTNVVVVGETPCLDLDDFFSEAIGAIAATLQFE